MTNSYSPTDIASDEPMPSSIDDAWTDEHIDEHIEEADIRVLSAYGEEGDGRTLVGLGPVRARSSSASIAEKPALHQQSPASEPPGPWGSDDDEPIPASLRGPRMGIWAIAIPLLLVMAGAAVILLRGLNTRAADASARGASAVPAVVRENAGLVVHATGDVRVFLDGQDRGRPPVLLEGLTPGSHVLSISGPAYATYEQPVTLMAGHVSTIEPSLTFLRGTINLVAGEGADAVSVEVTGANERREIRSLPARIEAPPGEYRVRAKKAGFPLFESTVTLSAAAPDAEVRVELDRPSGKTHGSTAAANGADSDDDAKPGVPAGTGWLSITSSPPSSIVLDGRPLGKSPRSLDVPSGNHTVVFIHPKYGRQSVTVNVLPDRTTSASADF